MKEYHGNATILLVEDEEMVRKLVCAVLQESGYTVLEASQSVQTLALVDRHAGAIDLLLAVLKIGRGLGGLGG